MVYRIVLILGRFDAAAETALADPVGHEADGGRQRVSQSVSAPFGEFFDTDLRTEPGHFLKAGCLILSYSSSQWSRILNPADG